MLCNPYLCHAACIGCLVAFVACLSPCVSVVVIVVVVVVTAAAAAVGGAGGVGGADGVGGVGGGAVLDRVMVLIGLVALTRLLVVSWWCRLMFPPTPSDSLPCKMSAATKRLIKRDETSTSNSGRLYTPRNVHSYSRTVRSQH